MNQYIVIVGNIGTVYSGNDDVEASKIFREYIEQSKCGVGRADGENVTFLRNDEIVSEHIGHYHNLEEFLADTLGEDAEYFKN